MAKKSHSSIKSNQFSCLILINTYGLRSYESKYLPWSCRNGTQLFTKCILLKINYLVVVLSCILACLSCFDITSISAINHTGICQEARNAHNSTCKMLWDKNYKPGQRRLILDRISWERSVAFQMVFIQSSVEQFEKAVMLIEWWTKHYVIRFFYRTCK